MANPRLELERLISPTDSLIRHSPAVPNTEPSSSASPESTSAV